MSNLKKYSEFINESLTPVMFMSVKNELKNSIVKFLHEKGQATRKEILEFASTLRENVTVVDRIYISINKQFINKDDRSNNH